MGESQYAILVDCTNAFNTISREAILEQLVKNDGLWPIYRLAAWSLKPTSLIVIQDSHRKASLSSSSGVRQGSVLGPLLFCLALQPILTRIKATCDVTMGAHLDDITICANDSNSASLCFSALQRELKKIGLVVNTRKTVALIKHECPALSGTAAELPCTRNGVVKLLGAAAWLQSTADERSAFVMERMRKHDLFFDRVASCGLTLSTQLALLQQCAIGRPTFLLRTHTWEESMAAAFHFDGKLEGALKQLVGSDAQLTDVASLPVRLGGLGLRSAQELAEIANSSRIAGEQHTATCELDEVKLTSVRATMSDRDRQILLSFAHVNIRGVNVQDEALRLHLRERLFLPVAAQGTVCTCGQELDAQHYHSCPSLGAARIRRHDAIKLCVAKLASRTHTVRIEPSRLLSTSRARPDLQVQMADGVMHVDVSCTYAGLRVQPDPLSNRAAAKRSKYEAHVEGFVPFVVASTGELHIDAVKIVARMVQKPWEREAARLELLGCLIQGNLGMFRAALA
jgi:hypothetical protein